jgi:ABC-type bacteriocin/lantibiotic exporter with double-glycine peptidase domain
MVEPSGGSVTIAGYPVGKIPNRIRARIIGGVLEGDALFSSTIAENVAFGSDGLNASKVWEALEIACVDEESKYPPAKPGAFNKREPLKAADGGATRSP